jgi:ligand-binding SRPBCC domain-containing protein
MRHTFEADQWLPYSVEQVFAFFANPENLPRLMPRWQKARIEEATFAPAPPRPASTLGVQFRGVAAGAGTKMTISFKPFPFSPFRIPWDAEITEFTWNDHFCDVQHRGPFAFWHHCHHISPETREGVSGTKVHDHVDYQLPLGPLGELANTLAMRSQFRSIFNYRHTRTAELLPLMLATRTPA